MLNHGVEVYRSIFLIVMEMNEMVRFEMGEDSCGLSKPDHRVVVKIFVHRGKTERSEQERDVQHCTCT